MGSASLRIPFGRFPIMRSRVRPNDKCPCGSGQKYKKCCSHPINNVPRPDHPKLREIIEALRQRTHKPQLKICMHPGKTECSAEIIKAHSIHRAGILSRIAKDGKVMMIQQTLEATIKEFPLDLVEEGNKKATTFRNFCKYHDQILFREIENKPYEQTEKQNFIYAFRVFAMQMYKKRETFDAYLDLLKTHSKEPFLFMYLTESLYYMKIALDELEYEESIFSAGISDEIYDSLETIVLTLDYGAKFASSTYLELNYDLKGKRLNNHEDLTTRIKKIFFNVFPQNETTYIILSWLRAESDYFTELKEQLLNLNQQEVINFLNNVIPCYTEHFVVNPDLWNSHSAEQKRHFKNVFLQTIAADVKINLLEATPYNLCRA